MKKTSCKRDVLIFNITLSHSEQKFPRKIASQKHEEKKKNAKISFHPSSHQQKKKKKNISPYKYQIFITLKISINEFEFL